MARIQQCPQLLYFYHLNNLRCEVRHWDLRSGDWSRAEIVSFNITRTLRGPALSPGLALWLVSSESCRPLIGWWSPDQIRLLSSILNSCHRLTDLWRIHGKREMMYFSNLISKLIPHQTPIVSPFLWSFMSLCLFQWGTRQTIWISKNWISFIIISNSSEMLNEWAVVSSFCHSSSSPSHETRGTIYFL